MNADRFVYTFPDSPDVPQRLRGLKINATLTDTKISFEMDSSIDRLTPEELAYFEFEVNKVVQSIKPCIDLNSKKKKIIH
jgi:hypothetical protein